MTFGKVRRVLRVELWVEWSMCHTRCSEYVCVCVFRFISFITRERAWCLRDEREPLAGWYSQNDSFRLIHNHKCCAMMNVFTSPTGNGENVVICHTLNEVSSASVDSFSLNPYYWLYPTSTSNLQLPTSAPTPTDHHYCNKQLQQQTTIKPQQTRWL